LKSKVLVIALFVILVISLLKMDSRWVLTVLFASLMYGFLSPVVYARRLLYLSTASSHIALLAVVLSIPLSKFFMCEYFWSILLSLALINLIGYLIHKGVEPDTATAIFVSFSASMSVIVMFIVLTNYPIGTDLWSLILGDPLLVSWRDVGFVSVISIITVLSVVLTYREQVSIGLERDCAVVSGINVKLYDFLFYTILAISTVAMIKVVGFVLQHVLILLPSIIAITFARNSKDAMFFSVFFSVFLALIGLDLAVFLNQAPSGIIGLLMFVMFIFGKVKRCFK